MLSFDLRLDEFAPPIVTVAELFAAIIVEIVASEKLVAPTAVLKPLARLMLTIVFCDYT